MLQLRLSSSRSPNLDVICPIDQIEAIALQNDPDLQQRMDAIENHWHGNPYYNHPHTYRRRRLQSLPNPLTIPLNIHILKLPVDQYIGYEQIISQIRVLNEDFMKENNDTTKHPEFVSLVGDFKINFSLNTIIRKDIPNQLGEPWLKNASSGGSDTINPSYNLNVWIAENHALGYAYYPGVSLDIDGVVIGPHYFGSRAFDHHSNNITWDIDPLYNRFFLGRTTTHEIGHYLNLVHIWGDSNCSHDDGVADTAADDGPNFYCPVAENRVSCNSTDMYMNYMDYVDDYCMNMFTFGQVDRGLDLFLHGGFRHSFVDYSLNQTDFTFVDYFYFMYGENSQCDVGHVKRDINLNMGTNGDHIYLCISYSNNPRVDVITDIEIISGQTYDIECNDSEFVKIDTNLNENAGGLYLYICYKKQTPPDADNKFVTDLNVFAFDSEWTQQYFDGFTIIPVNLNDGVLYSNKWVYLGIKYVECDYVTTPMTYDEAQNYCVDKCNKDLSAIINEGDIYEAKLLINGGEEPWIGLHNTKRGKHVPQWFEFYDDECPNVYSGACVDFWVDGVPKCEKENGYDCTVLYYNKELIGNDISCETKRPFLCGSLANHDVNNAMNIVKNLDSNNNDIKTDYFAWIEFGAIVASILINNVFVCWYCANKNNRKINQQLITPSSV